MTEDEINETFAEVRRRFYRANPWDGSGRAPRAFTVPSDLFDDYELALMAVGRLALTDANEPRENLIAKGVPMIRGGADVR